MKETTVMLSMKTGINREHVCSLMGQQVNKTGNIKTKKEKKKDQEQVKFSAQEKKKKLNSKH